MKKTLLAIISILLVVTLCACSNQGKDNEQNDNELGMVNPIADSSLEEIQIELGLNNIKFDSDDKLGIISKIDGDNVIYSIDVENNNVAYNLRICKAYENGDVDISGLYLDKDIACAIFDSVDENIAPSASAEISSTGSKVYAEWLGYYITLSTDKEQNADDLQKLYNRYCKTLLNSKLPKLIFENASSENDINIVYDAGDYKVKVVDGKLSLLKPSYSDVAIDIKQALKDEIITPETIVLICGEPSETIKDGGTMVYNLDNFTVYQMNTLDGNKDIIIGPSGADLYGK